MVDYNLSPIRPSGDDLKTPESRQTKSNTAPPSDDRFRKSMKERELHQSQEEAVEQKKESPSLFDLSKKAKQKPKTPLSDNKETASKVLGDHSQMSAEGEKEPEAGDLAGKQQSGAEEPSFLEMASNHEDFIIKKEGQESTQQAASLQYSQKFKVTESDSSFKTDKVSSSTKKSKNGKEEGSVGEKGESKGEGAPLVNMSIQPVGFSAESAQKSDKIAPSATIAALVTELVDKIEIIQKGDITQTTVMLSNPPVFSGAEITLTNSKHAQREFNISFSNLKPEAKILLDQALKDNSLTDSLRDKGIVVHILTTTTQVENRLAVDTSSQASRDRQDQQQQQDQQQKRQRSGSDYRSDNDEDA